MSEYTPTTEEVQAAFRIANWLGAKRPSGEADLRFARWLNSVQAAAWEQGVKSVNPRLSDDDDTLTFTIGTNPYLEGDVQ